MRLIYQKIIFLLFKPQKFKSSIRDCDVSIKRSIFCRQKNPWAQSWLEICSHYLLFSVKIFVWNLYLIPIKVNLRHRRHHLRLDLLLKLWNNFIFIYTCICLWDHWQTIVSTLTTNYLSIRIFVIIKIIRSLTFKRWLMRSPCKLNPTATFIIFILNTLHHKFLISFSFCQCLIFNRYFLIHKLLLIF